jgi:integrase
MTRKPRPPIGDAPPGLRQRLRADGTWRVWWEPRPEDRKLGFNPVELSADKASWSVREAKRLNAERAQAHSDGLRKDAPRSRGRTIGHLIQEYRGGVHFKHSLAPKTRKSYGVLLTQIEDKWGTRRVIDFDKAVMHTWYEALHSARGARMAQSLIRMMSILFSLAETLSWRPENSNPCYKLKIATPEPRQRSADWAEVELILDKADRLGFRAMGLAIRISLFQGQRETDVFTARRDAFQLVSVLDRDTGEPVKRWVWFLVRSKRQNKGVLPVHAEVVPRLREALAETGTADRPRLPTDPLLYDERTGRPYDEHLFAKRWSAIRAAAAAEEGMARIATLQFRDLRRTFGVFARAGGATRDDTGDVLGNSAAVNPILNETYMPPTFDTARRAVEAVQRPQRKGQSK